MDKGKRRRVEKDHEDEGHRHGRRDAITSKSILVSFLLDRTALDDTIRMEQLERALAAATSSVKSKGKAKGKAK